MKPARRTIVKLGGFWVLYFEADKGDEYAFFARSPIKREHVAHKEVCVAGAKRLSRAPAGVVFPVIRAGDTSDARPDLAAGEYAFEALEDATRCVQICASEVQSFAHQWIDLAPGERLAIRKGAVAALGGEYTVGGRLVRGPLSRFYAASGEVEIVAISRTIGVAAWPA